MSKLVRIPVEGGLLLHGGRVVTEVVLQEPSYEDYLELDEPETYGKAPDGTVFMIVNAEIVRQYIARCLVEPKDPLLLGQGGHRLARAVKGAVLGFFRDAPSKDETSETSPPTSSSNASPDASPSTPSAA